MKAEIIKLRNNTFYNNIFIKDVILAMGQYDRLNISDLEKITNMISMYDIKKSMFSIDKIDITRDKKNISSNHIDISFETVYDKKKKSTTCHMTTTIYSISSTDMIIITMNSSIKIFDRLLDNKSILEGVLYKFTRDYYIENIYNSDLIQSEINIVYLPEYLSEVHNFKKNNLLKLKIYYKYKCIYNIFKKILS